MNSRRGGIGNMIAVLHDQANRDTLSLSYSDNRKCEVGKHSAPRKGMINIGRLSCCVKCAKEFQK